MFGVVLAGVVLAGPSEAPIQVRVEPRLHEMNPDAVDEISEKVEERAAATLASEGHSVDMEARAELVVRIEWDDDDAAFTVALRAKRGLGQPVATDDLSCPQCTGAELVEVIDAAIPAVVEAAFAVESRPEPPVPEVGAIGQPPPPSRDQADGNAPHAPFRGLGLSSVVVGGVSLGIGVGLVAAGRRRIDEEPWKLRNYRPTGIGISVAGAALVATGVALLVVDRRRRKERQQVAVVPTGFGTALVGAF